MVKIVCKIVNLSLPNLACFAPWRESIPAFEYFRLPENLRELRKLLNIVVQSAQRVCSGGYFLFDFLSALGASAVQSPSLALQKLKTLKENR